MIWNGVSGDERLLLWKKFRLDIQGKQLEERLECISKFYANMPYGGRSVDYYTPKNWPTPWEILYHGSFCVSSISLLIFYTFVLVDNDTKADIYLIEDNTGVYLVPVINDTFVLNFIPGVVSIYQDIKDCFSVKQVFSKNEIKSIT